MDAYFDKQQFLKSFGVAVREARERMKVSTSELSRETGIAAAKLVKIEAAQVEIRETTIEKLAARLEIPESHLERLRQVARIKYIDDMMTMIWSEVPDAPIG